jgi:hypothetical protein
MGVLKAELSLSSTNVLTSPVNVQVSVNVNADSGSTIRGKVASTSKGGSDATVYKASDKLESAYVYVKNMDAVRENFIYVYADSAADDPVVLKIAGGEFAFLPAQNDQTLKAYGTKVDQVVEYVVFGLDSSSVTLG